MRRFAIYGLPVVIIVSFYTAGLAHGEMVKLTGREAEAVNLAMRDFIHSIILDQAICGITLLRWSDVAKLSRLPFCQMSRVHSVPTKQARAAARLTGFA
jgi:hypothetical protein